MGRVSDEVIPSCPKKSYHFLMYFICLLAIYTIYWKIAPCSSHGFWLMTSAYVIRIFSALTCHGFFSMNSSAQLSLVCQIRISKMQAPELMKMKTFTGLRKFPSGTLESLIVAYSYHNYSTSCLSNLDLSINWSLALPRNQLISLPIHLVWYMFGYLKIRLAILGKK